MALFVSYTKLESFCGNYGRRCIIVGNFYQRFQYLVLFSIRREEKV